MFRLVIFFANLATPLAFASRKYDIETEALKLYKEDFDTVLLRFRRTPEYLKILEDKNVEHTLHVNDMMNQITFYYLDLQDKKVSEMLGIATPKPNRGDATTTERSLREAGRQGTEQPEEIMSTQYRPDDLRRSDKYNKSAVERLDSYSKFQSFLTLEQRNAMKDLGFQFAGDIIHALIKNLGPDTGSSDISTLQPYDDDERQIETTTEHVQQHTIKKPDGPQQLSDKDSKAPTAREGKELVPAKRQLMELITTTSPLPTTTTEIPKKKHAKKKLII